MRKAELEAQHGALQSKVERLENQLRQLPKHSHIIVKDSYVQFKCADCGNPFFLNEGQMSVRFDKGVYYKCSAGHSNVFTKQPLSQ